MNWLDTLLQSDPGVFGKAELISTLLVMLLAFLVGHIIGWVYMWTHKGLSYSRTFVSSLVVLPVIVSLVMILMAGNIVIAFGLLAVFAVVRFRNVLKDTRDTVFILWAIVEGLAVGTTQFTIALVGVLFVSAVLLYLRITVFGSRHRYDAVLSLQLAGDLAAALTTLKQILHRHSIRSELASERRLSGQGLDLSYRLLLRDSRRSIQLQLELEAAEGIDQVALYLREDESEL